LYSVVWQQGTLMTPQHLQHQDAHHHAHLHARLFGACPDNTGILHLHLDALALKEGQVRLTSGLVIMPSGDVIEWDSQNGGAPLSRPLPDATTTESLQVFLVLPKWQHNRANVTIDSDSSTGSTRRRFVAQAVALPELTGAQTPPTEIMLAVPNATLAFAHELQRDDCHLHILTLHRLPHGGACVDERFIPQSLRLSACPQLLARLTALKSAARAAEQQARPKAVSQNRGWVEATLRHRGLLQLRNALDDLLGDPHASPHEAYRLLRACVPWVAAPVAAAQDARAEAARFEPSQPSKALWPLLELLEGAVAQGPSPLRQYPATQMAKSGLFMANLAPWPKGGPLRWFLQVHTRSKHPEPTRDGLAHKQATGAWLRLAKVAAPSQMPRLIRSALRGIALRALDEIPAELGADPEALVFALDTGDAHWPFIEQEGDMVLLPPPSGHDVLVEITVLCLTEGHS
jgi:type VI secretion system protein ImpJ